MLTFSSLVASYSFFLVNFRADNQGDRLLYLQFSSLVLSLGTFIKLFSQFYMIVTLLVPLNYGRTESVNFQSIMLNVFFFFFGRRVLCQTSSLGINLYYCHNFLLLIPSLGRMLE